MRSLRYFSIFLMVAIVSCQPRNKKEYRFSAAIEEGYRIIDSLQRNGKIPGIDVAVAIEGEIVWSQGFGFADLEHEVAVTPGQTRFRIGSVSKPITAAGLGRLIDQERLSLSDEVQTYVPYFPKKAHPISIKQLSGHLAGIRHYKDQEFLMQDHFPTVKSGIAIFADDSLLFKPGDRYSYSSYGYNLLSAVIEGASGQDFLKFMQDKIFDPLEMEYTVADKNDSIILYRTSFYQTDSVDVICNAPYVDNSYKWAGGGFLSTTRDLVKFGVAHMNAGFLSENTLQEFTTSQVLNNGDSTGYGVGWSIIKSANLSGYGHGGGSVGGITSFNIYPSHKMVVVLLSNSSNTQYGNVPERLANLFIGSD